MSDFELKNTIQSLVVQMEKVNTRLNNLETQLDDKLDHKIRLVKGIMEASGMDKLMNMMETLAKSSMEEDIRHRIQKNKIIETLASRSGVKLNESDLGQ